MRPIIIEGPDGSGKSTLARRLSADLGLQVHHPGGPPKNPDEFAARLDVYDKLLGTVIYDRSPHISEMIYSGVYERKTIIPVPELFDRLSKLKPVLIYCRLRSTRKMWLSIDQTHKPHKSTEHMAKVMKNYVDLVERYDEFFSPFHPQINWSLLRYDWFDDAYPKLLKEIQKCVA